MLECSNPISMNKFSVLYILCVIHVFIFMSQKEMYMLVEIDNTNMHFIIILVLQKEMYSYMLVKIDNTNIHFMIILVLQKEIRDVQLQIGITRTLRIFHLIFRHYPASSESSLE